LVTFLSKGHSVKSFANCFADYLDLYFISTLNFLFLV
jgi:hypothetical protein